MKKKRGVTKPPGNEVKSGEEQDLSLSVDGSSGHSSHSQQENETMDTVSNCKTAEQSIKH